MLSEQKSEKGDACEIYLRASSTSQNDFPVGSSSGSKGGFRAALGTLLSGALEATPPGAL